MREGGGSQLPGREDDTELSWQGLGMQQRLPYGIPMLFVSPCYCVHMAAWQRHTSFLLPKARAPAWRGCSRRGFAGVSVLSPVGATEFVDGFTLSVFGPNSAAHRWDARCKGAVLMHLDHVLWICFGGWTLGNPFWVAALKLWQRHEAGAHRKELQNFTAPGKAAHKKLMCLLLNRGSQAGIPSLSLQSYCHHRKKAVLNSGCGSRSPRSGCPNPSPLLPVLATIAFVIVSVPTSFPNVVVACHRPEMDHAHGQQ